MVKEALKWSNARLSWGWHKEWENEKWKSSNTGNNHPIPMDDFILTSLHSTVVTQT